MLKRKHESSYYFPQDDKELFGNMAERQNSGQPYIQTQTCVLPWREPEGYPHHWNKFAKQQPQY